MKGRSLKAAKVSQLAAAKKETMVSAPDWSGRVLRMPLWMAKALEPLMCMVTAQKIDWVVFPISSLAFHHKVEPKIFSECLGMPIKIAWVGGEYRWTEVKDANIVEPRDVTDSDGKA